MDEGVQVGPGVRGEVGVGGEGEDALVEVGEVGVGGEVVGEGFGGGAVGCWWLWLWRDQRVVDIAGGHDCGWGVCFGGRFR